MKPIDADIMGVPEMIRVRREYGAKTVKAYRETRRAFYTVE